MGHKINPTSFRTGISRNWQSRWFSRGRQKYSLEEDYRIREFLETSLVKAAVESIVITRSGNAISITVNSARPGIIIGRGGKGLEELRDQIKKVLQKISRERGEKFAYTLKLDIEEIRKPENYAKLVARGVQNEIERRLPFRRVMKQAIEKVIQQKDVQGVKIQLAGRLGGAEIARREQLSRGTIPLSTLRADIDYAHIGAATTYGVIGIKVWIYKGEKFDKGESLVERDKIARN